MSTTKRQVTLTDLWNIYTHLVDKANKLRTRKSRQDANKYYKWYKEKGGKRKQLTFKIAPRKHRKY